MNSSSKWSTAVCPIGLASELACDKWMPIILRDIGLLERRTFNQLLKHNLEGISSGSLAAKLKRLEDVGLITFASANEHKQKKLYYLTESGIDFVPVLLAMAGWSAKWHQPSAKFVEALRPYLPEPELILQDLLSKLRETNLERKKLEPMSWT
ncbi:MAG TPA: transcriptional regulator [Gammaproteobacteria bacterium]|nr:transcriptional regulator [Gammaproteobacteria bacterium]